jgi:hypothetical protein
VSTERTLEPDELRSRSGAHGASGVTVTRSRRGEDRIVVKTATGALRAALRRESELLDRLGGAGLVELLEIVERDEDGPDDTAPAGTTRMITIDAGCDTLADAEVSAGDTAVTALRRTVASVTRLHQRGWLHGSLRPDHVIVGARGRVRLCSLGDARPIDPADPTAVAADAEGLLQLVEHVARAHHDQHGWRAPRRARRRGAALRRLVRELRDRGAAPATTIEQLTLGLQQVESRSRRGRSVRSSRSGRAHVVITATVAALAAVVLALGASAAHHLTSRSAEARPVDSTEQSAPTSSSGRPCPSIAPGPDLDGDGCPDPVVVTGHVVQVGTRDYRLGEPGDLAVVGDWHCDGSVAARLVRPSTGEVFEFPAWATSGAPSVAELIGVDPDARHAVSARAGASPGDRNGSCDRLLVALPNGEEHEVLLEDEEHTP